jgi:hypothetical protein
MKCVICGITVDSIDEAIEQGWCPYFFDSETDQRHEPACGNCVQLFLKAGVDGEWELKETFRGKIEFLEERRAAKINC